MTDAFVVRPGEGNTIQGPAGGPLTYKVRGDETGGNLTVFEGTIAPGDGPPLHTHANEDEGLLIVEGDFRFQVGEEITDAPAGSFAFVPRGVAHCFQNAGDQPGRILIIFTPGGMERFFDRFAELPEFDPEAFGRLGAEVGMTVVGPPLSRR